MMAAVVEQIVAKRVVGKIAAGSAEPAAARSAITPVGNNVTLEVLMARKRAIALVAVPFSRLSVSSACIARMPKGVAAFPRPRAFAERLRIIAPMAGCSGGTSGNNRTISGLVVRAMMSNKPPLSATFISPRNSAMTPISPSASVTALPAASIMDWLNSAMGASTSPMSPSQVSWR